MNRLLPFVFITASAAAAAPEGPTPLWPKDAPGDAGSSAEERDQTTPADNLVAGKRVIRLGGVSRPTITVYRPPAERDTGAAVLVFPGGAYRILALDLEGTEICEWLNSLGMTAVLVKYRVPARNGAPRHQAPLQDAQRAIGTVRSRARELRIDPARIGAIGFSAGAHLAAAASTNFETLTYPPVDEADQAGCRPDFALLIYPAYLAAEGRVVPELPVSAKTPPTFLVQAENDNLGVECSLFYYLALKQAGVRAEMHLYPSGGHGYGLRPTAEAATGWPGLAEKWMRAQGLLEKRSR